MSGFDKAVAYIDRLFNEHKLVRRILVFWAVCLITAVTFKIFWGREITAPMATAFASVTALLTVVIGFYQWDRGRD